MPKTSSWTADEIADVMHKRDIEKKKWRVIAEEMGRSVANCQLKWELTTRPRPPTVRVPVAAQASKAPASIVRDRDYRAGLEPRDLTALLFGDPKPGYSALDKRQGVLA